MPFTLWPRVANVGMRLRVGLHPQGQELALRGGVWAHKTRAAMRFPRAWRLLARKWTSRLCAPRGHHRDGVCV